jgi:hypothetical protein
MTEFADQESGAILFSVTQLSGKGNGLVAHSKISKGSLIFGDRPLFRNCGGHCAQACATCGFGVEIGTYSCPGNCGLLYCSALCAQKMDERGHTWICTAYKSGGLVSQLATNDPLGHIVLAFTVYAKVLSCMLEHAESTAEEAYSMLVSGIQSEDYCLTAHAYRNGVVADVDEDLFSSLIAPAYFGSYLGGPLLAITAYFNDSSVAEMWVLKGGEESRYAAFLQSSLFTGMFLRRMVGMFVVNNLEITTTQSTGVKGTGLYKIYSKMNHSCDCNTRNSVGAEAEVLVYAARDIEAGEEITTSYLHVEDPCSLSRRARNEMLSQYLFTCKCALCSQIGGQPDDTEGDY